MNTRWLSSKNIVKRKNNRPFEQNEYFHRSQWTLSFVLNPRTAQSVHNNDKHAERHSCRLWGCRQTPHQHKYTNWTVLAAAFQHICDTHLKYVLLSIVCLLNTTTTTTITRRRWHRPWCYRLTSTYTHTHIARIFLCLLQVNITGPDCIERQSVQQRTVERKHKIRT